MLYANDWKGIIWQGLFGFWFFRFLNEKNRCALEIIIGISSTYFETKWKNPISVTAVHKWKKKMKKNHTSIPYNGYFVLYFIGSVFLSFWLDAILPLIVLGVSVSHSLPLPFSSFANFGLYYEYNFQWSFPTMSKLLTFLSFNQISNSV